MIIGSIILLAVPIVTSLAEESSSSDVEKRAPLGFQGMRGKKDVLSDVPDDLTSRVPIELQGVLEKKSSLVDDDFSSDDFAKRAPMGFQGMRGKKDYAMPDFEDSYLQDEYEKRAMMGFQGMRGKKTLADNDEFYKRAPMGFQGMRGKKSMEKVMEDMDKRTPLGRHGPREPKSYLLDYPDAYRKRTRLMGFQGMRGKKDEYPFEWEKRAPMGFQGMRGKKNLMDEIEKLEKRAIMGFQGMRGKKYDENYLDYNTPVVYENKDRTAEKDNEQLDATSLRSMREKRHVGKIIDSLGKSSVSFEGMADTSSGLRLVPYQFETKRSPYGYYGSRGKKNPRWELRGKFVGVRGKKWAPYEEDNRLDNILDNIVRINRELGTSMTLDMQ